MLYLDENGLYHFYRFCGIATIWDKIILRLEVSQLFITRNEEDNYIPTNGIYFACAGILRCSTLNVLLFADISYRKYVGESAVPIRHLG